MKKKFYVRSADDWQKTLGNGKFSDRELKVEVVERGIVLPAQKIPDTFTYKGGVCNSDFNFIAGFSRKSPDKMIRGG